MYRDTLCYKKCVFFYPNGICGVKVHRLLYKLQVKHVTCYNIHTRILPTTCVPMANIYLLM